MDTDKHVAIVVSSADYKENDKLVRLFTAGGGVISCRAKGVKKPKAKLKFACQPFAFCEYMLSERNGWYTLISATQIESLHALTKDIDTYLAGSLMIEGASNSTQDNISPEKFVFLLKLYKAMIYEKRAPYTTACVLFYRLLVDAGYGRFSLAIKEKIGLLSDKNLPSQEIENVVEILKTLANELASELHRDFNSLKLII